MEPRQRQYEDHYTFHYAPSREKLPPGLYPPAPQSSTAMTVFLAVVFHVEITALAYMWWRLLLPIGINDLGNNTPFAILNIFLLNVYFLLAYCMVQLSIRPDRKLFASIVVALSTVVLIYCTPFPGEATPYFIMFWVIVVLVNLLCYQTFRVRRDYQ